MAPRELAYTTVDAFTSSPFGGNPAAVIVWPDATLAADDALAQQIAAEFNLSETAFCQLLDGGTALEPVYELRWRTPMTEVRLLSGRERAICESFQTDEKLICTGSAVVSITGAQPS